MGHALMKLRQCSSSFRMNLPCDAGSESQCMFNCRQHTWHHLKWLLELADKLFNRPSPPHLGERSPPFHRPTRLFSWLSSLSPGRVSLGKQPVDPCAIYGFDQSISLQLRSSSQRLLTLLQRLHRHTEMDYSTAILGCCGKYYVHRASSLCSNSPDFT